MYIHPPGRATSGDWTERGTYCRVLVERELCIITIAVGTVLLGYERSATTSTQVSQKNLWGGSCLPPRVDS